MAVRLRYLAHDLEVPVGQFVIGRSSECQLSLDDPLVSRRHGLLTVHDGGASIEDLGSRNGVVVNGTKIEGRHALKDQDHITIGGQEITIVLFADSAPATTKRVDTRMRLPTLTGPSTSSTVSPPSIGSGDAVPDALPSIEHDDIEDDSTTFVSTAFTIDPLRPPDRRIDVLVLIGGVADKALAMGRADEAERLLQRSLADILEKAQGGGIIDASLAARSAQYATKLAEATGRGSWVDYAFQLYTALGALLPAHVVDSLYEVVRNVKIDRTTLRSYTEMLRAHSPRFSPGERFVQQRIEGLERLRALR